MIPVLIESVNGRFEASLYGSPGYRAVGATKEEAVLALQTDMHTRATRGELVWLDLPKVGVSDLAGRYKDDPAWKESWDEIVAEAYRERDAQKAREFPE